MDPTRDIIMYDYLHRQESSIGRIPMRFMTVCQKPLSVATTHLPVVWSDEGAGGGMSLSEPCTEPTSCGDYAEPDGINLW